VKRVTGPALGLLLIFISLAVRDVAAADQPTVMSVTVTPSASTLLARDDVRGSITLNGVDGPISQASVLVTAQGPQVRSVRVRTDASGKASFRIAALRAGQYHLLAATQEGSHRVASQPVAILVEDDRGVSIMLNAGRDRTFGTGETIWIRGRVVDSHNHAVKAKHVKIRRYVGSDWSTVATVSTDSSGWYAYETRAVGAVTYRAYVATGQYSIKSSFKPAGGRTIEVRARSLSFRLGAAEGPVVTASGVRWRSYAAGTLVQVGGKTWYVRSRILAAWNASGGASGRLGVPTIDRRCRLPEGACIQEFAEGTAYDNPLSSSGVTTAVRSAAVDPTLAAVALSQAGHVVVHNKYLQWGRPDGAQVPWCGIFLSWLAYAAGEPRAVPASKDYASLKAAVRSTAVLSSVPAVGRLAFISNVLPGQATHAGIVVGVSPGRVTMVEANVARDGGPGRPRGVFRTVHVNPDDVIFYADPIGERVDAPAAVSSLR
jgi:hypothetical protein